MSVKVQPLQSRRKSSLVPYLWISPAVVLLALFLFYPILHTTLLSFFEWDGFTPNPFAHFVGLGNFIELTQDAFFKIAFKNTGLFVLAMTTVELLLAFALAVFIFQAHFRGASWLRGVIFFPSVLSAIVVGIVWRNVVFLRRGLIDQFTTAFGLPEFFPLSDVNLAFYAIIVVAIWQNIGFNLVIFYAGLQSLDHEVLESAQIDGASFWQLLARVIAPLQWHVILVNVILNVIGGVKFFDLVYTMSGRGRGPLVVTHVTDVFASYMQFNAFGGALAGAVHRMGYAASIAVVMMIVTLVIAAFRQRLRSIAEL